MSSSRPLRRLLCGGGEPEPGLDGFRRDVLEILDAGVDGGILQVDVTYVGGCVDHHVDAVAYTGWMESDPVRVGVALAHDARGDACDASIQQTLRFDLEPLRQAYTAVYGEGNATLILLLEAAAGAPGDGAREVTYTF